MGVGRVLTQVRRAALVALVVAVVLVGVLPGCGDDRDEAQEQEGPFAVGTRSVTFVDQTRPTPAFGEAPARERPSSRFIARDTLRTRRPVTSCSQPS